MLNETEMQEIEKRLKFAIKNGHAGSVGYIMIKRHIPALLSTVRELQRQVAEHRGLLLWALYHHQGGTSHVGLPIRRALGIGLYDHLTAEQIATAKRAVAPKKQTND